MTVYVVIHSAFMQCIQHVNYPVKPSCKKYANLAGDFLAGPVRSCTDFASLAPKMKLFLQDSKILQESCKNKLQDNFPARFWSNLARILFYNYFTIISCKLLAIKIFHILQKSFIFSARLARYVQDLAQNLTSLARKNLKDLYISCKTVFTGQVTCLGASCWTNQIQTLRSWRHYNYVYIYDNT